MAPVVVRRADVDVREAGADLRRGLTVRQGPIRHDHVAEHLRQELRVLRDEGVLQVVDPLAVRRIGEGDLSVGIAEAGGGGRRQQGREEERDVDRLEPQSIAQRRVVDDDHLVGDRLGEERPVLEVIRVDIVGRAELVRRPPDDDLPPDLDVEPLG